jgi:prepilin-type N-terminal cleavage/methylation domain-containing protein
MWLYTQRGFSLVELLTALAISSVVVASMYGAFVRQQRVSTQQEQTTETRQNARLSMDAMLEEIREAGFDPGGFAGAGIKEADATHIRFTRDLNCNGSLASSAPKRNVTDNTSEDIAYVLNTTTQVLGRRGYLDDQLSGGTQPVASNIIGLKFCYILSTNLSGSCTSNPGLSDLPNIRAVQIALTARATAPDSQYTDPDPNNSAQYRHYRKATLTSLVHLRNLGINRGQGPNNPPKMVDFEETCALPHQ